MNLRLFFLLLCFLSQQASAAPVQHASYEEFQTLVKESVEKIPDLQELWEWQRAKKHPVYFGGGALRGLLRWLESNLRHHTLEEVRRMRVPPVIELLIQKNSDRDLYEDAHNRAWYEKNLPAYKDWRIFCKRFYRNFLNQRRIT